MAMNDSFQQWLNGKGKGEESNEAVKEVFIY